jgi:hypothetical protein
LRIEQIENCSLENLIRMIHKGWRVKEIRYKGFIVPSLYGNPCWITGSHLPKINILTQWFKWTPKIPSDKAPETIQPELGFNIVIFEKNAEE